MRLIKMLGLAVVAALAAMAFVGAGTASADTLCEESVNHNTGTCSVAARLDTGDAILGLTTLGNRWTLLAGVFKVECDSKFLAVIDNNEGSHVGLWALVDSSTHGACVGSCSGGDDLNERYLLLFDALELHALLSQHAEGGTPEFLLTGCPLGDCKYRYTSLPVLFDVIGDTLVLNEEPITRTAGLCPATGKFDATYLLTLEDEDIPLYLIALP